MAGEGTQTVHVSHGNFKYLAKPFNVSFSQVAINKQAPQFPMSSAQRFDIIDEI